MVLSEFLKLIRMGSWNIGQPEVDTCFECAQLP
jgi:hypothetical protein